MQLPDKCGRVVCDQVCQISRLIDWFVIFIKKTSLSLYQQGSISVDHTVISIIRSTRQDSEEMIKSMFPGSKLFIYPEVPFAEQRRFIPVLFQDRRNRRNI